MATNGKAWAHGSATHAARVLRNLAAATFGLPMASHANSIAATTRGGGYGVVNDGDLLVTTTGGLGYSVAVGQVVAAGTFALGQGAYTGYNSAAVTGNLAAHSAFIRHDLFCYRVRDTDEDATTFEDDNIVVVQGIAASTDPAIPSSLGSLVILARATVPATSGTVTYTDLRQRAAAIGGIIRCTSATRPTGAALYAGLTIHERDTGARLFWTGAVWVYEFFPRTDYAPTSANITLGNAVLDTDYGISNGWVDYQGEITLGTTSSFPGGLFLPQLSLPVPANVGVTTRMGPAWYVQGDAGQAHDARCSVLDANTLVIQNVQGAVNSTQISTTIPFTWESSGEDRIGFAIRYPTA